ncbi:MAG: response regulator [Methylococcales bacterium]|nr:response regulator [Methylococcales bacterium]
MRKVLSFIVVSLISIISINSFAQEFEIYTVEDGLSMNAVNNISQDSKGNIYLATLNGLNVFNGNKFKHYNSSNSPEIGQDIVDALPISENIVLIGSKAKGLFVLNKEKDELVLLETETEAGKIVLPVNTLFKDNEGVVWIGTIGLGLFSFPSASINSTNLHKTVYCNRYSEFNNLTISDICSAPGSVWAGTAKNGVYNLHKTNRFGTLVIEEKLQLPNQHVWCVEVFNDTLFVGTEAGLAVVDLKTEKSDNYLQHPKDEKYSNNIVRAVVRDKNGDIWVGTQEDGVYRMSFLKDKTSVIHYLSQSYNSASLNTNKILSLSADQHDNIWIGTWNGGLNKYSLFAENFRNIRNHEKANILSENMIKYLAQKDDNSVWLGTYGNGVCTYTLNDDSFHEIIDVGNNNSVSSIFSDKENGLLIVGTWGNGVRIYEQNSLKLLYADLVNHPVLNNDRVYSIVKDKHGIYWFGSVNGGVFSLNFKDKKKPLKQVDVFSNLTIGSILNTDVRQILVGSEPNTLFILKQDYGIVKVVTDENGNIQDVQNILHERDVKASLNSGLIRNMFFDQNENLYIGTNNGVIFRKKNEKAFRNIFPDENILVQFISEDHNNNIWVGTYSNGLIIYTPSTNTYKRIFRYPIFNKFLFLENSNRIIVASNSGIYDLSPDAILDYPFPPELVFDDFQVNSQPVNYSDTINGKKILEKHIDYAEKLTLGHKSNSFSVNINALSFFLPQQNKILYRLNGYEEIWHEQIAAQTNATYRNLPTGNYMLEVKAANINNVWNPEVRNLEIVVLPPWWKSNWIYFSYLIMLAFFTYVVVIRIKRRAEIIQQRKIEKITHEKEESLNEQKLQFFTNISHDLRTPLTLILGPLDDIISKETAGTWLNKKHLLMHKNAEMLLRLVNQILDFRKVENKELELKFSRLNLPKIIKNTLSQFESSATLKGVDLIFKESHTNEEIWGDSEMLEKVLMNLISNALKHTDKGGLIMLSFKKADDNIQIKVKDNGAGIRQIDLPNIFKRFYQTSNSKAGGTGIGLALAQRIIFLHHGVINVSSQKGNGSVFTIELPIGQEHLQTNEKANGADAKEIETTEFEENIFEDTNIDKHKENILAIDDNEDIRSYLKESLSDQYNVWLASNGKEGIEKARQILPSLIICDIMMDGIDGIEVCDTLKTDIKTSHIPLVFLTSKNSDESTIEGFEKGADDYIFKPFSVKILHSRINNLIAQRNQLRKKYSLLELEDSSTPQSLDSEFLTGIVKYIEENISNQDLSVENIAASVGMSHDQYYRKIRSLTSLSANKFTRKVRLKKSTELLKSGKYNVSEVLYMVGFSSPSYFTRCFKDEYGKSPNEFL